MQPMLNTAIKAARRAGTMIVRALPDIDRLHIETKSRHDFVTEVDRRAEELIIDTLKSAYPDHAILAEESGLALGNEWEWVIDPLDGTTNFLHGFPQFAISIGLRRRGRLEQAVVFDPLRDELFTASRGEGAQLNDRRIRVSRVADLDGALLGTGFPFRQTDSVAQWVAMFERVALATSGIRRAGSAALDLAYVACGRLDGFWETGLKPWDIAAGSLLVREAGGLASDLFTDGDPLDSGNILAGNPRVYSLMRATFGGLAKP
ncbi:MAG TPA: inositol monophosphatase family protein [Acidiferrobacter sp.]|nr:inositol monophosphatase family protein [Acidiferrobacter sp.]